MTNFQRKDSTSNAAVGKIFELFVKSYFAKYHNLELQENIKIEVGISTTSQKKVKDFDLGKYGEVIIECKSHSWTEGKNVPSAKLATWNEAMYFFSLAPKELRKIFAVEKYYSIERKLSLAQYYISTKNHLIPDDVEFWEFDTKEIIAVRLK